ncbi:helix-turn-helix domain-containing protein [Eubacteriales bacterium DFI.9.88]|nr:helix-turn-helix domain-containing protein [Eubacteriales bacterium DFI.9.88]
MYELSAKNDRLIKTIDKDIKGITKGAMKILYNYSWPGNIRELFNVIDRSAYFCSGDRIEEDDIMEMLPQEKRKEYGSREIKSLEAVRDEAEKQAIKRALELYGGNKSKAAQALGVTRSNLYHKMKKNHIE